MLDDLHRLTDHALGAIMRGGSLYNDGFGGRERLDDLVGRVRDYAADEPAPQIQLRFGPLSSWVPGVRYRRGSFKTPFAALLPPESRRGYVELLLPEDAPGAVPPVCLLLAATGEEGYMRRRVFAASLLKRGIGALILENPFYGGRRPAGQRGPALRTVADQFAMNLATVDESRALLAWLRKDGFERVGVTGYSQGGVMSAFAAAMSRFPLAAVPRGAGRAAGPIFVGSALSRAMNWKRLASEASSQQAAEDYFISCLQPVDVGRYPPPVDTGSAIILSARQDGFIPEAETRALYEHWPGSELRWLDAGHVTATLSRRAHLQAVLDAFDRLIPA